MFDNGYVLILLVIFVALWTAYTAQKKGRSPLRWGGVALIPVVDPALALLTGNDPSWFAAVSMVPMLGLVFIASQRTAGGEQQNKQNNGINCPRCQHAHEPGPSFCTNCGWELSKPYASMDTPAASADAPLASTDTTLAATATTTAAETAATIPEPTLAATQTDAATAASPDAASVPAGFSAEPLTITLPLTAAAMTERGLTLINQGRVREAVDQFTKAIALDPRYREAWRNRAKAYTDLGLSDKAAADQRQLEAI